MAAGSGLLSQEDRPVADDNQGDCTHQFTRISDSAQEKMFIHNRKMSKDADQVGSGVRTCRRTWPPALSARPLPLLKHVCREIYML